MKKYWKKIKMSGWLYLMFLLPAIFYIIFRYVPMYFLVIAFKKYSAFKGVFASEWVGLKWFRKFIEDPYFWTVLKNTVVISALSLAFSFPAPIIFALIINELRPSWFKKAVQTISYLPHFLSVVIVCGLITNMTMTDGLLNQIVKFFGGTPIAFLSEPAYFRPIYIISGIWQGIGWGSIIYLAALAGIDPELYDAASIDGASKLQQVIHVSIPGILPVVSIQLLLNVGHILDVGYEKIILLYTGSTYSVADVISTYVFRRGLVGANYSYGTAVSLFQSVISLVLIVAANKAAQKMGAVSLW